MLDERAYIAEAEAASAKQFAEILRTTDLEQQHALRAYFGSAKFDRLRWLAQRQLTRGATEKKGNVVILPGILGSELTVAGTKNEKVWFSFWSILKGDFDQLQVDASGKSIKPVTATAALRRYYGEMEQYLLAEWNVLVVPFDWRLSIRDSADLLADKISVQFGSPKDVHLVAHSMGGLVARSLAQRHPGIWASMGRLVMMGTPNYGSLAITQLYTGVYRLMRVIAVVDAEHNLADLLQFAKMFVGTYQMLPRTDKLTSTVKPEQLYEPSSYGNLKPPSGRFDDARQFQKEIQEARNPERMIYIAGSNQLTADGVTDWSRLNSMEGYSITRFGDGTVPHSLGIIPGVQTYYVEEEHSKLPSNDVVMETVGNILANRAVAGVATAPTISLRGADNENLAAQKQAEDDEAVQQALALKTRIVAMRGSYETRTIAPEEEQIADLALTGSKVQQPKVVAASTGAGFTGSAPAASETSSSGADRSATEDSAGKGPASPAPVATLRVHISTDRIQDIGTTALPRDSSVENEVDAIAVGHYIGVQPVYAELALDEAITRVIDNEIRPPDLAAASEQEIADYRDKLLLSQFTQRGIVRGELGRPFFLPDPRDAKRLIVIAGMGPVGRFGPPELTVLARELFWSLGRLQKKHLATVLIGSGSGNIETATAVRSWLRGAGLAILSRPDQPHLKEFTIVESKARKAEKIRKVAVGYRQQLMNAGLALEVFPTEPIPEPPAVPVTATQALENKQTVRQEATRILVELDRDVYRFAAVSLDASFPERPVRVSPRLVAEINDALAAQPTLAQKKEWGEFLFKLIVPQDVQAALAADSPIVLACDTNVAQLHWELLVNPGSAGSSVGLETSFLGLYPGVTRQLRNTFGGPPEPPPPSSRTLRILIVADTDDKRPLAGAAAEGKSVWKLFQDYSEKLKDSGSSMHIQVDALIGPSDATCAQVLKRLLKYPPYDILHYSGHCQYVKDDPPSSGWLFSNGLTLSANELSRVDRIPAFVFSNACESGVTPSRPDLRTPELAPTFAEAFFARGVKNFVCTAWPVADDSAEKFAAAFYKALLGFDTGRGAYLHEAMKAARQEIWQAGTGVQTWGAYQHYGNPWFKFI